MRILFLSRWFPNPADNGSKIRILNLLKQLSTRHKITLISFTEYPYTLQTADALSPYCDDVFTIPYRAFQPNRLSAIAALLSPRPRSVVDTYSPEMEDCVRTVSASFQPDLVIASQLDMAPYALLVPYAKRLLEELELTVLYEATDRGQVSVAHLRQSLTWQKHIRYVASILQQFDGCTVVSEQELTLVKEICPYLAVASVVPNGVDIAQMSDDFGLPQPDSLIYSGALSFYANLDAMRYFVQEIFPKILATLPQTRLKITGSITAVPVDELPVHPALTLTGYLPDVRPAIATSTLSVAPLRMGGGTRLKILESLALGTPVVTTSKGIEGLKIGAGEGILIADTPEAFAEAVVSILQNPTLRLQLSLAGRQSVQQYDWRYIGQKLLTLLDDIMQPTRRPSRRRSF